MHWFMYVVVWFLKCQSQVLLHEHLLQTPQIYRTANHYKFQRHNMITTDR